MLQSYAFGYYRPGRTSAENNIIYVKEVNDKYLFGTPAGFHLFDPKSGKSVSFTELVSQIGKTEITSYELENNGDLYIGTGGHGLFRRNSSGSITPVYRSGDTGADDIRDVESDDKNIWLATTFGVVVLDKETGKVLNKI